MNDESFALKPKIKLSICIATLNRAKFIGQTLATIIPQMTSETEIFILDGASSDETQHVVTVAQEKCQKIRYQRRDKNEGVDRDYNSAVEQCIGEYVWLMTDDDFLLPGSVKKVLSELESQPSLIVVNSEIRNADMTTLLQPRRLAVTTDDTFTAADWDRFVATAGDYLSFIGCVIIKREIWLARQKTPYFGTLFIHVGVILQDPLPAHIEILAEPFISIRYGNAMWRPREFEIWMFKWTNLIWSFPGIGERAKAAVCEKEPWLNLRNLLLLRAKGSYALPQYKTWLQPRMGGTFRGTMAMMITLIPGALLNCAALIYGRLTGKGQHTGSIDLKASRYYFRNWIAR
jgi:abequosyltransferase